MVAKSGGVPRDAPASFSTSMGNEPPLPKGIVEKGGRGGTGDQVNHLGTYYGERAQFVMEKVLEKKKG
jgi:hypothetical protein